MRPSSSRSTCWPHLPPSRRAAPVSCWWSSASRWIVSGPGSARRFRRPWRNQEADRSRDAWRARVRPEALPVSPALRQVLNEAMVQARGSDRSREVGTEHLLASLLSTAGPAAELLREAGLDLETMRERLTEAVEVDLAPLAARRGNPPARALRAGRRRRSGTNSRRLGQSRARGTARHRGLRPLRAR